MNISFKTPLNQLRFTDGRNRFFIKRDDLIPFSFGGNKVRIAQKYFWDMERQNCDCIIVYGSNQSNLCRVVANLSKAKGIPCVVILSTDKINEKVRTCNSLIVKAMGAHTIPCNRDNVTSTVAKTIDECESKGYKPYYIYGDIYGKGNAKVAVQAYVEAYEEIKQYEVENDMVFDYIFHASGTGLTQSGLICGSLLHNDRRNIIGISIARDAEQGSKVVVGNIFEYMGKNVPQSAINFEDKFVIGGYGKFNDKIKDTIIRILSDDGIAFDPIYTGKAFWGMREYLKENLVEGKNILFIHTGGLPIFFETLSDIYAL